MFFRSSLDDDMKVSYDGFVNAVVSDIANFIDESKKEIAVRLKDLFRSFSGDIGLMNDKRMQFPRFNNLEIKTKGGPIILARDGSRYWAFRIEDRDWTENGVLEFARRCASANVPGLTIPATMPWLRHKEADYSASPTPGGRRQ